jgi:glycosyltransferase involved in cell wall biosynthesis
MTATAASAKAAYVVVTPVRDEARHITHTIESMLAQTQPPSCWVIVDDGSTDDTPSIIERLTKGVPWIRVVRTGNEKRRLGSAEVIAFDRGVSRLPPHVQYEHIVKLDGDLRFEADYFERLLGRMQTDPAWGIASGVYCEQRPDGTWEPVSMPRYHAAGACKVVRRSCFAEIGGFVASKGWDTVDEIRAGRRGWKTGHFADIRFQHLKPEGAAMGSLKTHHFHGAIYYQTGGGLWFLIAKALHRALTKTPYGLSGLSMLFGYLQPLAARKPRLVDAAEARYYRSMLRQRLAGALVRRLGLR